MEVEGVTKLIADYGIGVVCLAVLISLHIYNVRVTMPRLTEAASKQVEKLTEASSKQIEGLVKAFREELAEERKQCHDDHNQLLAAVLENQIGITRLLERAGK